MTAGTIAVLSLKGTEQVVVDNGGAVIVTATVAQIAALSGSGLTQDITNTAITTVGNGTLTAAGIIGGLITRTGPTAAYTDTTDTASNIVAAIGNFVLGATFFFTVKNATAFVETLSGGTGVTLPTSNVVGPFQEINYFGTIGGTSASPTISITHLGTVPIGTAITVTARAVTALNTVGAGTLTAAAINGGAVSRTGAQSNTAFTDTTDTAVNILANNPGLIGKTGASFLFWYQNTTNATATLAGGTGVTVSGITAVPAGTWALYLLTAAAGNTVTMVGIASAPPVTTSGTFTANGATAVVVANSNVTANSIISYGLKTVGGTPGSKPYESAITPGTGFSVKATAGDTSVYNYLIIG